MGALTREEIVFEGLQRGGQPGLTTRANQFLNTSLRFLHSAHDWPFLEEEATVSSPFTAGRNDLLDLAPLSLYRAMTDKMVILTDNIGPIRPAWEFEHTYDDVWAMAERDALEGSVGNVQMFVPDPSRPAILLYPNPGKIITAKIRYFTLPAPINITSAGDGVIPQWPDDESMILLVEEFAKRWRQMSDLQIVQAVASQSIARVKATSKDRGRGTLKRMKWAPWFYRTRGRE